MRKLIAVAMCSVLLGVAGCVPGSGSGGPGQGGGAPGGGAPGDPGQPPSIAVTGPKDGETGVSTAAEVVFTVLGTRNAAVRLVDAAGNTVEGALRGGADASTDAPPNSFSWLPAIQLAYATQYTATITADNDAGRSSEAKATFTTMSKPANLVTVTSFVGDDQVIGTAMPMIVEFGLNVPVQHRAQVERRLFVRSDPPQVGTWHWYGNDIVHYRPRAYWRPGTKIDVRIGTGGLWWGVKDWYGLHDLTIRASVGPSILIVVDNKTKKLTVTRDGKVLRTMPVSLGKASTPSSSGTMVIIERLASTIFNSATYGVPVNSPNGYETKVQYAMRLTWGGEFIHAAPWSVAHQGRRNVSHGCVNISTANAKWLFDNVRVGDPVVVRGTEVHVTWGNGWTDWDRPWEEYVKGSALPNRSSPSPSPIPSPSGS